MRVVTDMHVAGRSVSGRGDTFLVYDPATEEVLAELRHATADQADAAVAAAKSALPGWAALPHARRSRILSDWQALLVRNAEELLDLVIAEVGSPIATARPLHVDMPLTHLDWIAQEASKPWDVDRDAVYGNGTSLAKVRYVPVGVVAAISAYNYPLTLPISKVGAALAAGCTAVLMPSEWTPLTGLYLVDLASEAGVPDGVLNVIVGDAQIGQALTKHPDVAKVSFTGSVGVGRQIMRQAADSLKGLVLELGGKSPNILLPGSGTQPRIVEAVHFRYSRNAGQGCTVPSRILVHRQDLQSFMEISGDVYPRLQVGDPRDPTTIVGPLIRPGHRDRVEAYVEDAIDAGATIAFGGGRPGHLSRGWYTNPVLLTDVEIDARIAQEEVFGPVAVLFAYSSLDEAVEIANATELGLGADIWGDVGTALQIGSKVQSGFVSINGGGTFRPDVPFGGFKQSGLGREWGEWGIREFLQPQTLQWAAEV